MITPYAHINLLTRFGMAVPLPLNSHELGGKPTNEKKRDIVEAIKDPRS